MPEFELKLSGVTVEPWLDPASGSNPSRLNPRIGRNASRLVAVLGDTITLSAVVDGVPAPEVAGRKFICDSAEAPHPYPVGFIIPDAALTSVQQFTPTLPGHYLVYMRRNGGGGKVFAHIDVEPPT
jgi:hypothetical protein